MKSAGLTGFKPIPASQLTKGKQIKGVSPGDVLGGFYYVGPNLAKPFGYTVVAVKAPSTLPKLRAGILAEGGPNGPQKFLDQDNVLISMLRPHSEADKATAARLPLIFNHLH